MEEFFSANGVKHLTIPPYNPQSSGMAECGVKTVKSKLNAALSDSRNANAIVLKVLANI